MICAQMAGVSKSFGAVKAVRDIDLAINAGEFLSIYGPPSSGKTTILRMLLGLTRPDHGQITIEGRPAADLAPADREIGIVFQNLALFPHLSARDNIAFPLHERRVDPAQIQQRIAEIGATLDILPLLDKLPGQLSGGERQRVSIARALIKKSRICLMDEPLSALDARLRETVRIELKRLQKSLGIAFVYVTNDQESAMSISDRICVLRDGQIQQIGSPAEIYYAPVNLFVSRSFGTVPINVLDAVAQNGMIEIKGVQSKMRVAANQTIADGPCRIGIRPEAVTFSDTGVFQGKLDTSASENTPKQGNSALFSALIGQVEPLGTYVVTGLRVGDCTLRSIAFGQSSIAQKTQVQITIQASECYAFASTGDELRHDVSLEWAGAN